MTSECLIKVLLQTAIITRLIRESKKSPGFVGHPKVGSFNLSNQLTENKSFGFSFLMNRRTKQSRQKHKSTECVTKRKGSRMTRVKR